MVNKMKKYKGILLCIFVLVLMLGALRMEVYAEEIEVGEVSLGNGHQAVVKTDGSLWMWGGNSKGQLGDGTKEECLIPKKIMEDVKHVSLGFGHTAVIKTDGSLWMWGDNSTGQLGDGTKEECLIPKKIMEDVKQVSLGDCYSGVIKTDGSLWVWGDNTAGKLGDGTEIGSLLPKKIMEDVKMVSLMYNHSAAIKSDGSLWMWGNNWNGKLGDGTETNSLVPEKIMEDVVQVDLGLHHSAAIKTDGSLWMWGWNYYYQLGDGTRDEGSLIPKKMMGDVKQVSLGHYHSTVIKTDGSLWVWGLNDYGQLGDGTKSSSSVPKKIMYNVKKITRGNSVYSAAIKCDGSLWMWGNDWNGKPADGINDVSLVPKETMSTLVTYSVSYNANGGTDNPETQTKYHGKTLVLSTEKPTRAGYTFLGWSTDKNATAATWKAGGDYNANENNTLYAVWKESIYTITYNANGGTSAPEKQTKRYGKNLILRTKIPTRKNYVFQGWATSKTATKATYKAGGTYKTNKDVTLYAVWKKKQTITASNKTVSYKSPAFSLNAKASGGGKLTYVSSNKKVVTISTAGKVTIKGYGKATITIKAAAKGEYLAASKKITVTVNPKKVNLKSVTSPGTKKIRITWVKDSTVTGYNCQISTSSKFVTNKTHKTYQKIYGTKASMPVNVSGLVKGKTYYVRVRAYKKLNGTTYNGTWSAVKKIKVK